MAGRSGDGAASGPAPSPDDPTDARIPAFLDRIGRRLREGPYGRRISVGMRRDVTVPFDTPGARVPISTAGTISPVAGFRPWRTVEPGAM